MHRKMTPCRTGCHHRQMLQGGGRPTQPPPWRPQCTPPPKRNAPNAKTSCLFSFLTAQRNRHAANPKNGYVSPIRIPTITPYSPPFTACLPWNFKQLDKLARSVYLPLDTPPHFCLISRPTRPFIVISSEGRKAEVEKSYWRRVHPAQRFLHSLTLGRNDRRRDGLRLK